MKILEINQTDEYLYLKGQVLSSWMPWCYQPTPHGPIETWFPEDVEKYNGGSYFSHCVLRSPGAGGMDNLYPQNNSEYLDLSNKVIRQIIGNNDVEMNSIIRINFNMTFPSRRKQPDRPHVDHQFPHNNMLVYFTATGGRTVVEEKDGDVEYTPVEDTGIAFGGDTHYHYFPETGRRVVMVVTYI